MNLNKAKSISDMFANREICMEINDEPSMVLPCHNLTVQQIFEDYCRGVIHTTNCQAIYDTDDINAEPTNVDELDFQDVLNRNIPSIDDDIINVPSSASAAKAAEGAPAQSSDSATAEDET